ncbi:MAG: tRNA dihydrouridine synthase DusB [Clostridia bacterium]|nr:tRNA dihydrouridine synthase DusB [Clostridia bacterium]
MKIGNIEINPHSAALAPMAGVADKAFRELCVEYGATYVVSEMVSSKGLTMCDRKSKKLLSLSENERPAAAQIFGSDPKIMAESAVSCLEYKPDVIDINMGCPAPKIAGNGGGSALLKNPDLAEEIMKAVKDAVDIPVTVKIRLGWDSDSINCIEMAQRAQKAGMSAVTLHGRTRQQMYAPPVDRKMIAEVKKNIDIPLIANGDITDGLSAAQMIEETNCDYLMVGRGALGRPWVFSQITAYLEHEIILPEPPVSERMRVMIKHIKRICEYKGERVGIREARKHAAWYIKGIKGAAAYRQQVGALESIEQLEELAFKIMMENI